MADISGAYGGDERKWRRLLRGAFSIPDLVNDESALEAIAVVLLNPDIEDGAMDPSALEERLKDSRKIVRAFVKLGGKGKLDRYLVRLDLSSASAWDGQAEEVLAEEIVRESGIDHSGDDPHPAIRHLIEVAMTVARNQSHGDADRHDGSSWVERRSDRRRRQ